MAAPLKSIPGRSTADCICDTACIVKSCSQCHQVKPLCKFYYSNKKRNLRRANCKECSDIASLRWTNNNKLKSDLNRVEYRKDPRVLHRRNELEKQRRLRDPRRNLFNRVKRRAKEQGIEFNLSISDINLPGFCPMLGIELLPEGKDSNHWHSVDRINPTGIYEPSNIIVVSMRANRIKSDATIDELRLILDFMERQGLP